MELKGKRLLYIGGSASITDIAFYTKSHGIKLLVAINTARYTSIDR